MIKIKYISADTLVDLEKKVSDFLSENREATGTGYQSPRKHWVAGSLIKTDDEFIQSLILEYK